MWAAKSVAEIVERDWEVPVAHEDSLASFTTSATGVTIDAEESNGDTITLTLSGGTLGTTGSVAITATTKNGLVIAETFYLPIRGEGYQFSYTVRDVCDFALRKVVGVGAVATATELSDATERLSDMLASWSAEGIELDVKLPCDANDTLFVPDWAVDAIKANLRVAVEDFYSVPETMQTVKAARTGLQRLKAGYLPDRRDGVDYF